MATYHGFDILDAGLALIKADAEEIWLLDDYAVSDDYAAVLANKIASVTITNTDFTGPVADATYNRKLTFDGKAGGTASANSVTGALHMAIVDVTGTSVLWVTDETTDQAITSGNPVTFPSFSCFMNQPTAV